MDCLFREEADIFVHVLQDNTNAYNRPVSIDVVLHTDQIIFPNGKCNAGRISKRMHLSA